MSSSLFDNWGSSYESYPNTDYVKGDKKFIELKKGDILYALSEDLDGNYQWEELIITNPWHDAKGHCYISCKKSNGKKYNINFGPNNYANVRVDGPDNSIVYYDGSVIGTNKESIYNVKHESMSKKLNQCKEQYEILLNELNLLEKSYQTMKDEKTTKKFIGALDVFMVNPNKGNAMLDNIHEEKQQNVEEFHCEFRDCDVTYRKTCKNCIVAGADEDGNFSCPYYKK